VNSRRKRSEDENDCTSLDERTSNVLDGSIHIASEAQ
jgi:hypothetical protein